MGRHREKIDIIASILTEAEKGSGKTHIMYYANLNYDQLRKYISEISERGLVVLDGSQRHFQVTDLGRTFLETYKKYFKATKQTARQLNEVSAMKKLLENMLIG